jgi:hypothetical protein
MVVGSTAARRSPARSVTLSLATLLLLTCAAAGQSIETTYVVLGENGAIARAVLTGTTRCPTITIDNAPTEMHIRALPDTATNGPFPVLVCEMPIPAGTTSATIAGSDLPLPKPTLASLVAFGDTGCRLKANKANGRDSQDDDDRGKFQDCNNPSLWPFARIAASVAAAKPDLVIHVGDYVYRESPCPTRDQGCAGSPYGDDWASWKADFFAPAAPALRAAPWIVVRGNHEICQRAGRGYFRLLDPNLAQTPPRCIDLIPHYKVAVGGRSFIILDSSDAADTCRGNGCDAPPYAAQFAGMRPQPGNWLLSHRPIWGFRAHGRIINATLQQALAQTGGRLPAGIDLVLSGHIHMAQVLSFADRRAPQLVLGTGGTLLAGKIKADLSGRKIDGNRVSYGRADHRFGFALITPGPQRERLTAAFHDTSGKRLFTCAVGSGEVTCD